MKKFFLSLVFMCIFLVSCSETEKYADTNTEVVPEDYGKVIEAAKEEFDAVFSEYEDLKITETATMVRSEDENHIVVQMTYTSENGSESMGLNIRKMRMVSLRCFSRGRK